MVQHLLLMTVAAPLILLGAPVASIGYGLPEHFVTKFLVPLVQHPGFRSVGDVITQPVVCWLAGTVTVLAWHIPAIFELAMRSYLWHEIQHAAFFTAGVLFWWPVIGCWPTLVKTPAWSVPLYLFLATFPCDALSAFLTFCDRVVYASYLSAPRLAAISPLQDQEIAGALMWVWVEFFYLVPAVVISIRLLSPALAFEGRYPSAEVATPSIKGDMS
jgi:cytochrome c oxidase assembly factor CtaG